MELRATLGEGERFVSLQRLLCNILQFVCCCKTSSVFVFMEVHGGMCVCVVGDAPNELSRAVATKCSEALGSEAGVAENVEAVRNRQKRPINSL